LNPQVTEACHHGGEPAEQFLMLTADAGVVPVDTGELPVIGTIFPPVALETKSVRGHFSRFSTVQTGSGLTHSFAPNAESYSFRHLPSSSLAPLPSATP
jgi:hypothetical protein